MGTETKVLRYRYLRILGGEVKLNNPLMGTETYKFHYLVCQLLTFLLN